MRKINYSYVILIFILLSSLILNVRTNLSLPTIPSYDSYYFLETSKDLIEKEEIPFKTPNTYIDTPINYPSSFPLLISIFSIFSGIGLDEIYKFMGPISFLFLLTCCFVFLKRYTGDIFVSIIGTILLGSIPYNLYRSTMPLPEIFVLSVVTLILFLFSFNKKYNIILISILLAGGVYLHYRSLLIPLIIIFLFYGTGNIKSINKKNLLIFGSKIFFVGVLTVLLILPIFSNVLDQYIFYISGKQAEWRDIEFVKARYILPTFLDYEKNLNIFPIFLGIFGFFYLIKNGMNNKINLILIIMLIFTFVLTQSLRFGFYAPPYRFYSFLSIFLIPLCAIGLRRISSIEKNSIKIVTMVLIFFVLSINFVNANLNKTTFVGIYPSDLVAANKLNSLNEEFIVISYGGFSIHTGVKNSEGRYDLIYNLFSKNSKIEFDNFLKENYPRDRSIYIFIIKSMHQPMIENNPIIEDILKNYDLFFRESGTVIYKVR